jgi:uncharacterized protein YidB (DUF937 family)
MDIAQMGAELLKKQLGNNGGQSTDAIAGVLQKLVGNGDQLDIGGMLAALQNGGLASIAASWLGDGANESISSEQVRQVVGDARISQAAAELGTDEDALLGGLSEVLPQMIDKSSSGGSLLDAVGGLDGALNMAKKLF